MKPLLKKQKAQLTVLLNQQEAAARLILDRAVGHRHDEPVLPRNGQGDRAYAEQVVDRDLALAEHSARELDSVAQARCRLGAHTYGICAGCHADISFARLVACPTATRCEGCQELHEQTHDQLSHTSM
jgi:RNA polymerase-binding transcription factor DksA